MDMILIELLVMESHGRNTVALKEAFTSGQLRMETEIGNGLMVRTGGYLVKTMDFEDIAKQKQFGGEVIALLTNCYLSHWVEHACVWISSFNCGIILKYYCENHAHVVVFLPN